MLFKRTATVTAGLVLGLDLDLQRCFNSNQNSGSLRHSFTVKMHTCTPVRTHMHTHTHMRKTKFASFESPFCTICAYIATCVHLYGYAIAAAERNSLLVGLTADRRCPWCSTPCQRRAFSDGEQRAHRSKRMFESQTLKPK